MDLSEIRERESDRKRADAARLSSLFRVAAFAGLIVSAAMLPSGRNLPVRFIGYVIAALVVPVMVSLAARQQIRSAEGSRRQPKLRWVWMFNLAAWGMAIVHAIYVVRRFL